MKRTISLAAFALTVAAAFLCGAGASAFDEFNVWPGLAPGEKEDATKPTYEYWKPEKKTSDSLMIVCPGGAYNGLAYGHEGGVIAQYFNSKGITAVVLKYRVPRREGLPKHMAAWQDAQRCVRVCRSRAKEWGIDPNKIGILGFSAGGHLTLMIATTSQTNAYDPIDEIDKLPCNVNYAVLIHGDSDRVSPMGSVAVYSKLRKMNIPAEMHIYAKIEHGFGGNPKDDHVGDWLNRVYAWMGVVGF